MERLRIERAKQHLTLEQLSERSGVGMVTISEIERGKRKPHAGTLTKLAEALSVPVKELTTRPFPGADEAPPEFPEETSPKAEPPPLNELLEAAGCTTNVLAQSDKERQKAYEGLSEEEADKAAIQRGRAAQEEWRLIEPRLRLMVGLEHKLHPEKSLFYLSAYRLYEQAGQRYLRAYADARKALEGTDDPTDGGRFPPPQTLGAPEPKSGDELRYVIWEEVEPPELVASATIP